MKKIELLSPAGDLERLKVTLLYGADAVYIGGEKYSLRANANNFSLDEIREGCSFAHKLSKKVHLTLNIVFHNEDMVDVKDYIDKVVDAGIDAFILDTHNRIHVEKGVCILTAADRFGDYISILPYGNKISGLSIRGFKYEARNLEIELTSSRGVSNELTHDVGMITCDDYFVVMETKD